MKCKHVREMMGVYLYGDLAADQMREVRTHTQQCGGCREDLESRGRVIACLSDATPELTDEERQTIAWKVRARTDAPEPVRQAFTLQPAQTFAFVAVLIIGLIIGAWISTRATNRARPLGGIQAANRSAANERGPVVRIMEEKRNPQKKKPAETASKPGAAKGLDAATVATVADALRRAGVGVGTLTNRGNEDLHKPSAVPSEPAPIAQDSPKQPDGERDGPVKLPQPSDLNDARSTQTNSGQ